ncbi:adenosylcobinamide-GDP ribazoletransferase [Pseudonocardia bannensis]|uniref:Adenosylcobinamide-GDP ribazoletransferase n=1 Tax=Pseudonocardia bannensis TaxID=630973 RepID=A0A848DNG6_9PSEU|nr:adenosylcobinamide-GDP ribazoletransferase [Pseudonocardia bannensis]NMH93904.1 adenosylcobinamide-GDP ribazoletransferase [Pseudonocardia bannensis]
MRGLALAVSWLTVLPVRAGPADAGTPLDPRVAAAAIRWAPLVGALLGATSGAVFLGLAALGVPPLVGGLLTVGFAALATRGMHLDGLADTADGLGCYGPPERALAVMRDGGAGPFAVVTLLVTVGAQAAALAALAGGPAVGVLAATATAAAVGRAGFAWCARRGVTAARPGGLGSTVAGSQPWWVAALWWAALAGLGVLAVPGRPWQGPIAVLLAALVVVALSAHTRRRFGGMTGDVLGAAAELGTTATLIVLSAH